MQPRIPLAFFAARAHCCLVGGCAKDPFDHWLLTGHQPEHCCLLAQEKLHSPESSSGVSGEHAQLCHTDRHGWKCCLCQDLSSRLSLCFPMEQFGPPGLWTKAESSAVRCLLSCPQVWQSRTVSPVYGGKACEDPHFLHKLTHRFCVWFALSRAPSVLVPEKGISCRPHQKHRALE